MRGIVKWSALALMGFGIAAACGNSGVVGGECRSGFLLCDGLCVDANRDEEHCGACGNACPSGVSCREGECETGGSGGGGSGGEGSGGDAGGAGESASSAGGGESGGAGGTAATGGASGAGGGSGVGGDGSGGMATGGSGGAAAGGSGGDGGTGTGGAGTGGAGTGGAGTGGAGTGGTGTGGAGTGGTGGGTGGSGGSPGCYPPHDTPAHCGDCDTQCSGGTPLCAPAMGGGFECVALCEDGLTPCSGQCVDLQTSPLHCGACDNVCPSGLCVDGDCVGATPGHVVYICMDYTEVFRVSAQTTLLGNAVFLNRREPVRVLAYSEHALMPVMNSTDRAIRWAADALNRTVEITHTDELTVIEDSLTLSNYEVLLVYDQSQAPSGAMAAAGSQLATTLDDFTSAIGVVIVMSGATGVGEMGEFASNAGLLDVTLEADYTDELAFNHASGDVVGLGVVTPFRTLANSCTFTTSEAPSSDTVYVVTDTDPGVGVGQPIVVHKTVAP